MFEICCLEYCSVCALITLSNHCLLVWLAAFAGVKLAVALADFGLFLVGNVKTCHKGVPKLALKEVVLERGDRACWIATTPNKHGEPVKIMAVGDMDKQPMFLVATAGTTLMGQEQQRRRLTMYANGDSEVHNWVLPQWVVHALYRMYFNKIDKHNQARQGGHGCLEDANRTQTWWVRDFFAIFGTHVINFVFAYNFFGPPSKTENCKPLTTLVLKKMLAHALLKNPVRMQEVAHAASAAALRRTVPRLSMRATDAASEASVVTCKFASINRKEFQQGRCRYCADKTATVCLTCSVPGSMDALVPTRTVRTVRGQNNKVFFVCSSNQRNKCILLHLKGIEPKECRVAITGYEP